MLNEIVVPPEDKVAFGVLWCQSPESETEVYRYLRPIFLWGSSQNEVYFGPFKDSRGQ